MAPLPYLSSQSGQRITVNDWVKDPQRISVYVLSLFKQGFLADAILRPGGDAPAGVVRYEESTPLYVDASVSDRAEGEEIPIAAGARGVAKSAYSVEKALRVLITDEMQRRNSIDVLNLSITQVVNTIIRAFDDLFIATVLAHPDIFTQVAGGLWSTTTYDPRPDMNGAAKKIEGAQDGQGSELGYEADTLIVNRATKFDLLNNEKFNEVYHGGNIADENLRYTGKLPFKILNYNVVFSPRVPADTAIMLQRGTCGFICDEVPLEVRPLILEHNGLDHSSAVRRSSVIGIDQPKSICKIDLTP